MAVTIDIQAFRDSLPHTLCEAASRLREAMGDLESCNGGVQALVRDGEAVYQPWVGIVERAITGECDCVPPGDDLCAHAVAVVLAALDEGVAWSGAAFPPNAAAPASEYGDYVAAVGRLAPRQLTELVVRQAARDRLFAAMLLSQAGMLDAADETGITGFRAALHDASNATTGRWEISDVESAGHRLVTEAEILCTRPATLSMVELMEEAIVIWDDLSGYLIDAYHSRRTDPQEISGPLVDAHLDLCERLGLAPDELAERLNRLMSRCSYDTVDIDEYAELLGDHAGLVRRSGR